MTIDANDYAKAIHALIEEQSTKPGSIFYQVIVEPTTSGGLGQLASFVIGRNLANAHMIRVTREDGP